jgi:hypothetical protein
MSDVTELDPRRFPPDRDEWQSGYLSVMAMDDGRAWCLMPLTLGRLRIVIAEDCWTAGEHWCYSDPDAAYISYLAGPQTPPTGWTRHMLPDGSFEYPEAGTGARE